MYNSTDEKLNVKLSAQFLFLLNYYYSLCIPIYNNYSLFKIIKFILYINQLFDDYVTSYYQLLCGHTVRDNTELFSSFSLQVEDDILVVVAPSSLGDARLTYEIFLGTPSRR